jgi:hypothetical protein
VSYTIPQSDRQAAFRLAAGVTTGGYNENLIAASEEVTGVTGRHVNEAEILLLQSMTGLTSTELNGLRAALTAAQLAAIT